MDNFLKILLPVMILNIATRAACLSYRKETSKGVLSQAPTHQSRKKSYTSLKDPACRVVHRPQGIRKVDIVFVHGLGGTSRLT